MGGFRNAGSGSLLFCNREPGIAGGGNPAPWQARGRELVEPLGRFITVFLQMNSLFLVGPDLRAGRSGFSTAAGPPGGRALPATVSSFAGANAPATLRKVVHFKQ